MSPADIPVDELTRLETLASLQILDTPPDEVLTGLARVAATLIGCPIAHVSLVDTARQWFKASIGTDAVQTTRDVSFCAHAILSDRLFEVSDASVDPRFADNPLVTGEPHIRFYAGVPLEIDGHMIGTLCVIDRVPRRLDDDKRRALVDLGNAVAQWMKSWRQQNELRETEAYRRLLFDRLGDGVMLLDMHHRILDANPTAIALLGYERAELLAMRGQDIVADFERDRFDTPRSPGNVEARRMSEWEFVHKTGHHVPLEVHVRRLDETRYLAVLRDITQRRSRDQLLRQLLQAVEQSVESVVVTNLDRTIEYVNTAATLLFGYERDELVGQNTRMLRSGETSEETYDAVNREIAAGRSWQGVLSSRRKDGTVYLQSTVLSPIRAHDGRITHTLASLEDVTEKVRMSEELDRHRHRLEELVEARTAQLAVAMEAAEAASTAKSDFLLTMSHEIRTPMNGVIGSVDVLRQSSLTPYQRDLSDTIRESALALLIVIDDMLDFSKIEAGGLALESESVCLYQLIEGICDSLHPHASGRNVGLQVFIDPRLPDFVRTDPIRLRQILNNLVGNAIKFSAGRELPGRVRVSVEPDVAGGLCLKVADNGIGMTTEVLSRIFQPFVQADSSTARRFGGTGLGLSICHRLTMLFGGTIDVTSVPDEGTCFAVRLPLHADEARGASVAQTLSGVDCHLVLADAVQSEDWCSYLRSGGASATSWSSASAARDGFAAHPGRAAVLLIDEMHNDGLEAWIATADDGGPLSTVRVGRGQRRTPRPKRAGEVSIDGDAQHRDALLNAVALAIGRAEPEGGDTTSILQKAAAPTRDEAARQGRLILVAEDNEINQVVIKRQLDLLGFAADVVSDGIAALAGWRTRRYGLLLTDIQMPGIDGYELARAIRSAEDPDQHMPIVALTANALPREADRCLLAGMDAYLNKPVQLEQLATALDRWLPARSVIHARRRAEDAALPVLDLTVLRRLIGGDDTQIAELHLAFERSACAAAEEIRGAALTGDWERISDVAHRLKSSSQAVGALALGDCCRQLEQVSDSGDAVANREAVTRFQEAIVAVGAALSTGTQAAPPPRPAMSSRTSAPPEAKVYGAHEVREAIGAGQLLLHFQPKVVLPTGALVGAEALVRWNHPLDGLLRPKSFIPVAMAHGLIGSLTKVVISMALEQTARWRKAGLDLRVAINVTTDDLARAGFVESLLGNIDRHRLQPTDVILEIAESRLMKAARVPTEALVRLRLEHVGLCIDDFGAGHSSLSQLRSVPFDEMKIDGSFVHGADDRSIERAIFSASLDMAHELGMTTVAEGVQDRADWDFVVAAGCDSAQGHFIAPPMSTSELTTWAAEWERSFATA